MTFTEEQIARVCHEAIRAIQVITGDESPAQPWDAEAQEIRESAISGVKAAMSGMTPEELHEEWCRWKTARGWKAGPVKDPLAKTHPTLVPYGELPEGQRVKDRVFAGIVAAMTAQPVRSAEMQAAETRRILERFAYFFNDERRLS